MGMKKITLCLGNSVSARELTSLRSLRHRLVYHRAKIGRLTSGHLWTFDETQIVAKF